MRLTQYTAPLAEPIALAVAKSHLRVDGTDEDELISALITAARQHVEAVTRRAIMTQVWDYHLAAFPDRIVLPRAPLRAVESISYVDTDGATQTLSAGIYTVDVDALPGEVYEAYGQAWPSVRDIEKAIRVRFTAGYATPFTADSGTDVLSAAGHPYSDGDVLRLTNTGGALPDGLSTLTDYYVVNAADGTLQLSSSAGGSAIDITGAGTGTHLLGEVPGPIRHAMLLLIAHLYDQREVAVIGNIVNELPFGVQALLAPYRVLVF